MLVWIHKGRSGVLPKECFRAEALKVGERIPKFIVFPVPPCQRPQSFGYIGGKSLTHDAGRVPDNDGVIGNVLRHHRPAAEDCACADGATGENNNAVADPHIMANRYRTAPAPLEEIMIVLCAVEIGACR